MKAKKGSETRDNDGASDQKQDPLERRRLQNRLSQRNHRRKIRDRIAKLQERVIANELRAAAALNDWDQSYPQPLLGNRFTHQQNSGLHNGSSDPSFSSPEPFSTFGSSYGLSLSSSWPSATLQSSTSMCEDSTWIWNIGVYPSDTAYPNPTLCDFMGDGINQPFLENSEEQTLPGLSNADNPNSTGNHTTLASQPLYYAVTESALPQILRVLSSTSPQSKIIVLVSPDEFSPGMGYPSSTSSLLENSGLQDLSQPMDSVQSTMCQCQSQGAVPPSMPATGSRAWASTATPYLTGCPSKINNTVVGGLSSARL